MLNGLDLFTGIGGFSIALREIARPVAYCEIEPKVQAILMSRMSTNELHTAPIWDDVRTLSVDVLPETIDIVYGGFPCQPWSSAARGRNKADGMHKEFARIVNECQPTFLFAENTAPEALRALADLLPSYQTAILELDAAALGAPHIRRRSWLLGYADENGESAFASDVEMAGVQTNAEAFWPHYPPDSFRVVDGLPFRMDATRALGNAVAPEHARAAFHILCGLVVQK